MSAIKLRDFASIASDTLIVRLKDLDDIYSFLEILHCRPKSRDLLDIKSEIAKFPDLKYIDGYLYVPYRRSTYYALLNDLIILHIKNSFDGVLVTVGF